MLRRVLSKSCLSPKTPTSVSQEQFFSTSLNYQQSMMGSSSSSYHQETLTTRQETLSPQAPLPPQQQPQPSSPPLLDSKMDISSAERFQRQQQYNKMPLSSSASTSSTTSSTESKKEAELKYRAENEAWKIVAQLYRKRVNFDNRNEVQQQVSEACKLAFPNSEEKRKDLEKKAMMRIEERKGIDPYGQPLLYL